jgi:NAD(P)-dependent dehydrogenase (short-subunit alcohol dehydrogenase family)
VSCSCPFFSEARLRNGRIRPKTALPETLASAKKVLNGAVVLPSDSGDLAAAQALGEEVKKYVDHLDGAFLNAGIATFVPIEAATPKNYDDMFNVNVRGLYFQLQSLLPLLGNPSSVVFTSSIAGSTALAGASIYSATKAAVICLGRTLAVELAKRGVRVNALSPGPIDTPILKKAGLPPDQLKGYIFRHPPSFGKIAGTVSQSQKACEVR